MAEVRLGRLAENRSSNPAVVQFAQQMERDHSQANDQLRRLARNRDMTLPTDLNADQRNLWQRLSGLQGRAFDRAYAHAMLDAHRKAVALFAARANTGRNDPVSGWASDTLPTLREHLRMARDLVANVDAIRPHRSHGNGNWNGNRDGNMNRNGYRNP